MHNFQQFIDYVYSFYGKDGLYDQNRTKEQIAYAVLMYLDDCNDPCIDIEWGDGDSLDRERVRDYMNEIYGPVPVIATEQHFTAQYKELVSRLNQLERWHTRGRGTSDPVVIIGA